jgi:hypothetical protein
MLLGMQAVPNQRRVYTSQTKWGLSATEILKLPQQPTDPIQKPDGTFLFMLGYSPLGGPDELG